MSPVRALVIPGQCQATHFQAEQELEGLDEALTWLLSVQHALGSGNLAAEI